MRCAARSVIPTFAQNPPVVRAAWARAGHCPPTSWWRQNLSTGFEKHLPSGSSRSEIRLWAVPKGNGSSTCRTTRVSADDHQSTRNEERRKPRAEDRPGSPASARRPSSRRFRRHDGASPCPRGYRTRPRSCCCRDRRQPLARAHLRTSLSVLPRRRDWSPYVRR
jgi:hypothetical protein